LHFAAIQPAGVSAHPKSRPVLVSLVALPLLLSIAAVPAFSQLAPPEPDPLSRIRAQAPAPACSEAEPTLCAEAAPKIIANAMGSESTIAANVSRLIAENGGVGSEYDPNEPTPSETTRMLEWAEGALRDAGLSVYTETYAVSAPGATPGRESAIQQNVIAEIRGRENPDEIVVLAASLDSWRLHYGALFNVCNAAVLIEAARDIAATGLVPRRTIRFVLFSGDGSGTLGSAAYVQAHRSEMDRTIAVIDFGAVTGHIIGYSLGGRHDIEPGVREALAPLNSLGPLADTFGVGIESDGFNFLLEGVPNLGTEMEFTSGARFEPTATSAPPATDAPPDPLGNVDIGDLKRNAAIAGVTAFDVAEDLAPLGPRLSHAEIEALLKQTGLDEKMKAAGIWPQWESGQLGHQP
jgi:hypothetical protein